MGDVVSGRAFNKLTGIKPVTAQQAAQNRQAAANFIPKRVAPAAEAFTQAAYGGLGRELFNVSNTAQKFTPGNFIQNILDKGATYKRLDDINKLSKQTYFPEGGQRMNSLAPTDVRNYTPEQQMARTAGSATKEIFKQAALMKLTGGLGNAASSTIPGSTLAPTVARRVLEGGVAGGAYGGIQAAIEDKNPLDVIKSAAGWGAAGAVGGGLVPLVPNVGNTPYLRAVPRALAGAAAGYATAPLTGMDPLQGAAFGLMGGASKPYNEVLKDQVVSKMPPPKVRTVVDANGVERKVFAPTYNLDGKPQITNSGRVNEEIKLKLSRIKTEKGKFLETGPVQFENPKAIVPGSGVSGDLDPARVKYYVDRLKAGKSVDPLVVSYQKRPGGGYDALLEDGKHRLAAMQQLKMKSIPVVDEANIVAGKRAANGQIRALNNDVPDSVFKDVGGIKKSTKLFRGDNSTPEGNLLGDGLYFTPDKTAAKSFGKVSSAQLTRDLKPKEVLRVESQAQLDDLFKKANEWSLQKTGQAPGMSAISEYAKSKGYKAIVGGEGLDSLAGVNILDKKLVKIAGVAPVKDPLEALKAEARKYKSADDYLTAKLGGYNQIYDKNLGSRVITTTKGNIRYTIKESDDSIKLFKLLADKKGTGVGDDLVKALKDYADATGKPLVINTPNKFWDKYDWLKKMPNGRDLEYKPTDLYNQATRDTSMYGNGQIGNDIPKSVQRQIDDYTGPQPPTKKTRGLIQSAQESSLTRPELRDALPDMQYGVLPNKKTMELAVRTINKNPQAALNEVLSNKPRTTQLNAQGLILAEKAQQRGDFDTAAKIFQAMAPGNTKQGQAIQILSVWGKTKPEGVVRYAKKVVDDANNVLITQGRNPSLTLSADKAAEFRKLAQQIEKMPEGRDKMIATQKMLNEIHRVVPSTIADKLQTSLYYAQLLNPKTAIRNIIGNTGMVASEMAKDAVGAPIDATLTGVRRLLGDKTAQRTVYMPRPIRQLKAALAGGKEAYQEARAGVNLSGLEGQLQIGNRLPAFKGKAGQAIDKAMQIELSVPDRAFYAARYQQSIDNQMKAAKVKVPTRQMREVADFDARYATFQDDSLAAKAFVKIKKALNGDKDFGVGSFVLNYPKTPGNILARGIDYSPAGFIKTVMEAGKPLVGRQFNQKAFVESFSRALVGTTGLVGTGAMMHRLGIITGAPSKDKDVNATDKDTGLGAYRINVDALKRFITSGFDADAAKLRDGDNLITYDWFQPAAIGISMGANIDETKASDKGVVGKLTKMLGAGGASLAAGAETLAQQPLIQGLTKLTGQGGGLPAGALAIATGIPAAFVPTVLNQINQLMDNTSRSTYDPNMITQTVNQTKAKIPGLAQTLEPVVNPWGENNERYQNGGNNPLNVFLNPAFTSKYDATNVQKEVQRLQDQTGKSSQYPATVNKTQTVNGEDVQLSAKQITEMQRVQGELTTEAFGRIMQDPKYKELSDTDRVKRLENIITDANAVARVRVLGDQVDKNTSKSVKKAVQSGQLSYNTNPVGESDSESAKNPRDRYQQALEQYSQDQQEGGISDVNLPGRQERLNRLRIESNFDQDTVDLYSKSYDDIVSFVDGYKNGKALWSKIQELDKQLVAAGYNSKIYDKNGNLKTTKKGRSSKAKKGKSFNYASYNNAVRKITSGSGRRIVRSAQVPSFSTKALPKVRRIA